MEEIKEPAWGPVGLEVYERTYQRSLANGEPETWADTVKRVVDGNINLVDERFIEVGEKEKLNNLYYNFKSLPAGRHLWVSGVQGRQFISNCFRSGFTNTVSDHYAFSFDMLMQGGGVGSNYSDRYIDKLNEIKNHLDVHIVCDPNHSDFEELKPLLSKEYSSKWDGCFRIEDSREGWVDALRYEIDGSYGQRFGEWIENNYKVIVYDVSLIRERGKKIRGFGGVASGPYALAEMLIAVNNILNSRIGKKLPSLGHMLIDHEVAKAVVAGNVRRSARMSIKSWKDDDIIDFIHCKDDWQYHWTTNISVEIDDDFFKALKSKDERARDVYRAVINGMVSNGEPGFYNVSLAQEGEVGDVGSTNPCAEVTLEDWESCILGHVNLGAFVDDFEGAKEAFRLMTRFLIRATFADKSDPKQAEVVARNRRIGVGFFGFQSWLVQNDIKFSDSHRNRYVRKTLRDWKSVVDKEKRRYAFQLRIPEPIKGTTIAPTGSIAKLCGETEGIHTVFSPYVIRNIRYSSNDPKVQEFIDQGYEIEDCLYTPNTKVVRFYMRDPLLDKVDDESLVEGATDVGLADMLAVQAMVQECYADNAVSFTVNFEPDSLTVEEAEKIFIHYLPYLKGTTLFPSLSRPQSPYEKISKEDYELYNYIKTSGSGELSCGVNACPVK